jgi:Ca2+-binding EF-hand superfamily protein
MPDNPKAHILDQLKRMLYYREKSDMQQPKLFTNEEFELMFETYDLGQDGYVPYFAMVQALEAVGVSSPVEVLTQDFAELNVESKISRPKFVQVLMTEFTKRGYSY